MLLLLVLPASGSEVLPSEAELEPEPEVLPSETELEELELELELEFELELSVSSSLEDMAAQRSRKLPPPCYLDPQQQATTTESRCLVLMAICLPLRAAACCCALLLPTCGPRGPRPPNGRPGLLLGRPGLLLLLLLLLPLLSLPGDGGMVGPRPNHTAHHKSQLVHTHHTARSHKGGPPQIPNLLLSRLHLWGREVVGPQRRCRCPCHAVSPYCLHGGLAILQALIVGLFLDYMPSHDS